jgi:hypothetical protein
MTQDTTKTLRIIAIGLLTTGLQFASSVPKTHAQALNYQIVPGVASLPAGSYGASLTATVEGAPQTLNFSLCFVTGYGSSAPIVPSTFTPSGTSAAVALTVPASTIQQVPPSAFTSGSFSALLYAVPAAAASCNGPVPSAAATIALKFPRLVGLSLPSAPQFNPKLTTRLPASVALIGTDFLAQTGSASATPSTVSFTANVSSSDIVVTPRSRTVHIAHIAGQQHPHDDRSLHPLRRCAGLQHDGFVLLLLQRAQSHPVRSAH